LYETSVSKHVVNIYFMQSPNQTKSTFVKRRRQLERANGV
jgi:hypothetical protein